MDIEVHKVTEKRDGSSYNTCMDIVNQKQILGTIFQIWARPHIEFMPVETIKENILTSIELAKEITEWKKNATLSKKCKTIMDYISTGTYTKNILIKIVYNAILSSEGFGLRI